MSRVRDSSHHKPNPRDSYEVPGREAREGHSWVGPGDFGDIEGSLEMPKPYTLDDKEE